MTASVNYILYDDGLVIYGTYFSSDTLSLKNMANFSDKFEEETEIDTIVQSESGKKRKT